METYILHLPASKCEYAVKRVLNIGHPRRYCNRVTFQAIQCRQCGEFHGIPAVVHFICDEHLPYFLRETACPT